jgi:Tol biopolymer transport system component
MPGKLWMTAGAAAIAIVAAAAGRYLTPASAPAASEMRLDIATPLVPNASALVSMALSPDGGTLAFVAEADGATRIFVRPLSSPTETPLKGTEGASYPFWKPDGRSIAFFARGMLNRLDLNGGAVRALAPAISGRGGAWTADGTILFTPGNIDPLYRIPEDGGTPVAVTRGTPGGHYRFPQLFPDGRHALAFSGPTNGAVHVVTLATGDARRLFEADTAAVLGPSSHLLFARDGTLYARRFDQERLTMEGDPIVIAESVALLPGKGAFTASAETMAYRRGERVKDQLVWLDRSGTRVQTLAPPDSGGPFNAEVARDGRVVMQRLFEGNTDIWLAGGDRGGMIRATTNEAAQEWCPVWAPDGQRFAFASNPNGSFDLFERSVSGAERVLLASNELKLPTDWSRDGRFLLYRVHEATRSDLWALPLENGEKAFPVVKTRFDEREGQFSPDSRWIAYQSDESGGYQIYLQPFPGPGERIAVSVDGGTQPRWSPDGRELFYLAADESLMSAPVSFTAGGRAQVQAPTRLFQTRISFGAVPGANRQQYAVAPDGKRFLVTVGSIPESAPPITVVLNWRPDHAR